MQRQAWETVGHLQQDWRKDPKRVRYAVAALSGQQEYIPRVLFLYPHNGSVMRDVVNDYVRQGFPNNLHFYYSLPPFLNSIRKSIQIMSSVFEEAFS
ncbi:hypothetical protein AGDE_15913 [Angomonas deanei]|nr:hypothetical protein AGDE_15913 [Angomonas deanei]|eukprot:EPY18174.1 hypothetical protein AGDE_15913 [Angomonas deanei]